MPELPDVIVFKDYAKARTLQKEITEIVVKEKKVLEDVPEEVFTRKLVGNQFIDMFAHGKNVCIELEKGGFFVVHFGMTGFFQFRHQDETPHRHTRFEVVFRDDTVLDYVNQRLLGRLSLTESIENFLEKKGIGPDARTFNPESFVRLIGTARSTIKTRLMDQKRIAGLGNIYCDEVLFQSGIYPKDNAVILPEETIYKLYHSMHAVIEQAVASEAKPEKMPKSWLIPVRKEGNPCPKCTTPIERIKINNRGTFFCPRCQHA